MLCLVYMYATVFLVFTVLHLYGSIKKDSSLRNPTKPVILLAILGMYLEWVHYKGSEPSLYLVAALMTSWLGDILLIPKGVQWFTAGGILFWISHFLFILTYWKSGIVFSAIEPAHMVLIALIYTAFVTFVFSKLKKSLPERLFLLMYFYLLTNGAMNAFAWFRLLSGACSVASGLATAIGAVGFFVSDSLLFFVRFDKSFPVRNHFPVMLTYSLGEFLIVLGLMLLV